MTGNLALYARISKAGYQSDLSTAWLLHEFALIDEIAKANNLSSSRVLALRLLAIFERGRVDGLSYEETRDAILVLTGVEQ